MIDVDALARVEQIIREVAADEILPRFQRLRAADVTEKAPGDPVTVADRAAEERLTQRLQAFLPGSVVVGEERVGDEPGALSLLEGPDPVWIIDPIDGTRRFIAGDPCFATLVSLAQNGRLLASWTHGPAVGVTATALAGQGAWVGGHRVRVAIGHRALRGLDVTADIEQSWPEPIRHKYAPLAEAGVAFRPLRACGLAYVDVAQGHCSALILTWDFPWDHVAGVLLVAEAGGDVRTGKGEPYSLKGGNELPLVAAAGSPMADLLLDAMRG